MDTLHVEIEVFRRRTRFAIIAQLGDDRVVAFLIDWLDEICADCPPAHFISGAELICLLWDDTGLSDSHAELAPELLDKCDQLGAQIALAPDPRTRGDSGDDEGSAKVRDEARATAEFVRVQLGQGVL